MIGITEYRENETNININGHTSIKMDINSFEFTKVDQKIFRLLCLRTGEKLSQREIAKIIEVSPMSVSNSVKRLENIGLVSIETLKTINFISFDRDSHTAAKMKQAENLRNIYLSGLSDYLEEECAGSTIILFGSFQRGEDTIDSDIDIAVIGRKYKVLQLERFEKMLYRSINVNFYDSLSGIHRNLRNNILNGLVLQGNVDI